MRTPRLFALLIGGLIATAGLAVPADAHMGGKVQLFLKDLKVQSGDGGYNVTAVLVDRDSGGAATGFQTTVAGARADGVTFPETKMTPEQGGVYRATIPAEAGDWTITLRSVGVPGTPDAVPLVDQKRLAFPAAGAPPVEVAAAPSGEAAPAQTPAASTADDDGGGGGAGVLIAVIAAVVLAGLGGVFLAKRRRPEPAL